MDDLDLNIKILNYNDRNDALVSKSDGIVECYKCFPYYYINGNKMLFKPLSKEKPFMTPLFAYSEVICSYIVNKYFDKNAPLYYLAICKGIEEEQLLAYEKGTIVNYYLKDNQRQINIYDYFEHNPDINVNIKNYINLCPCIYNYLTILNSSLFQENEMLQKQLVWRILLSYLTRDVNFHYENVSLIYENDNIISLIPPIDFEYSTIFMYAESLEKHKNINEWYNTQVNLHENSIVSDTIKYITEKFPDLINEFLNCLEILYNDLDNYQLSIFNSSFIGVFNSEISELQKHLPFWIDNPQKDYPHFDGIEEVIINDFKNSILSLKNVINYHLSSKKFVLKYKS